MLWKILDGGNMSIRFHDLALVLIIIGFVYVLVYLKSDPSLLSMATDNENYALMDILKIRNIGIGALIAGAVCFVAGIKTGSK